MNHDERRRQARYVRPHKLNLSLKIKRRGLFFWAFGAPQTATWMDFSRDGMAFEAQDEHPPGDQVLLDLSIGDQQVDDVVGVVRNTGRSVSGYYRHGVRFDFEANEHMRSRAVAQTLGGIEDTLKGILAQQI